MRLRSFAFAVTTLVLSTSGVLAQWSAISLLSTSCNNQTCTFSMKFDDVGDGGVVATGGPYSGWQSIEMVETVANGTHRTMQGKYPMVFRDSSGRVRLEYQYPLIIAPVDFAGGQHRVSIIEIRDPIAGYRYILDSARQVAHRQPYHSGTVIQLPGTSIIARSASAATTETLPDGGTRTTVGLGKRDISGVTTYGVKVTRVSHGRGPVGPEMTDVRESWVDPQTSAELLSTDSGSDGIRTVTMNDYKTSAPDAALFRIPEGYRVVDETGAFDIVQPNPTGRGSTDVAPGGLSANCDGETCTLTWNPLPGRDFSILNAPWSGREKTEITGRTLRDGTKLPDSSRFGRTTYRDSKGRLRTEPIGWSAGGGRGGTSGGTPNGIVFVEVQDPVAGYRYLLDPVNRVAYRMKTEFQPQPLRRGGFGGAPGSRTAPDGSVITIEDLPRKIVFGADAVGYRQTRATPAGKDGFDQPVVNVNETWTDPITGVVLISKTTGINGENTRSIPDYKAVDPDPAVFQVPDGYKTIDETGTFQFVVPKTN